MTKHKSTAPSIMQSEKVCYISGTTENLNRHEVFFGKNRQNSLQHGCYVYLTGSLHNQSNDGVHFNHELDIRLKKECQAKFEETHTRAEFMRIFGRNYL